MALDLPFSSSKKPKDPEFPESELVLNGDGSVYHLSLKPEDVAETVVVVGDPGRVFRISKFFDSVDFEMNKREFTTHVGSYRGKRLMVVSSGIGTDNVEIVMNELDALVNVNFKTRRRRSKRRKLTVVRVGTSGALQPDLPSGTLLASEQAVGLDTLMHFYQLPQTPAERRLALAVQEGLSLPLTPYVAGASPRLLEAFGAGMARGVTVTCPGFYAPQGRKLRYKPRIEGLLEKMTAFSLQEGEERLRLTNAEMETAAYYAFAQLLGHEAVSLNALVANRVEQTFAHKPNKVIDNLIGLTLDRLAAL